MLSRYTFWLWVAVIFQLITAVLHSISLFVTAEPATETERQLLQLMQSYRFDAGAGFHPSMSNLFIALSSCFSFVCLLGGLTNAYLLRNNADPKLMKGTIGINLLVFGGVFAVMAWFTFLPPIIFTGLIFLGLLVSFVTLPRMSEAAAK